ncbi:hypothetical protein ABW20_dc0109451 [Dactylellina cionopaga]|nr:hypothetical protein ABW20_dc0109451 [Dactylellina cionopaga]
MIEHQDDVAERGAGLRIRVPRYLEGWDFNHLAADQDFIDPRVAKIQGTGTDWIYFTRAIQAVVLFGCGFGELIKPQGSYSCARWSGLPKGEYYLAAAVRDLKKIMYMNGGQEASPMKLTDEIVCHSPQLAFGPCECKGNSKAERHTDFAQVLLPSMLSYDLPPNHSVRLQDGARRHEDLEHPPEDTNHYTLGSMQQHNVVAACLPSGEYGTCAATDVFVHMKRSFPRLKICLLVGIGGGVPSAQNDIRLGDVVVSHPKDGYPGVIQYDLGKTLEDDVFLRTGSLQRPPRFIMTAVSDLESDPDKPHYPLEPYLKDIATRHPKYKYPGHKHDPLSTTAYDRSKTRGFSQPGSQPKIHYGLIASGNRVMKSAQARDRLGSEYNILCFEMEAAGIMNTGACLVIRGICDYSDSHKSDLWQEYAAATAAAYAKLLLSYTRIPNSLEAGSESTRSIAPRASPVPTFMALPSKPPKRGIRSAFKTFFAG